ncbi:Outer membrane lipoprotein-sorting protein [Rhodoblastus acidophilus]|uniref:Outer membrane lipoprotein-sorting protein n=2 Tax=Rhodoblastus acidophilus TaxID=1074 RepID=A0A212S444_RHOAC|nr:Outer membrane lipoprotein-sorting protein [Rhodoblastus acidophilus]
MKLSMILLCCGLAAAPAFAQSGKAPDKKVAKPEVSAVSDPDIAIQMADDYFNSSRVMTADFVQTGQDGRRAEGKLYVLKPGRMRFEYAQPATMEIIADGVSVAIRDRKLKTQETYFVEQTPLKFLLKNELNLKKDVKITNVTPSKDKTVITLEDSSTFGGSSTIRLYFDAKNFNLTQWAVKDPQGYETLVVLHNIDRTTTPNLSLFHIPNEGLFSE